MGLLEGLALTSVKAEAEACPNPMESFNTTLHTTTALRSLHKTLMFRLLE